MRRRVLVVVAVLAQAVAVSERAGAQAPVHSKDDLARARALDKEGAKAYGEGRFNDAIRYFTEAHRLGGPPFELWNIAKCHLRLDQPEQAAEMLERYLANKKVPTEDREEARKQLDELKARSSILTVSSTPSGATVSIDGKDEAGKTPVSMSVPAGSHTVNVRLANYVTYTQKVEARYGRAIIVDASLEQVGKEPAVVPPAASTGGDKSGQGAAGGTGTSGGASGSGGSGASTGSSGASGPSDATQEIPFHPVALRAGVGVVVSRHGSIGGSASVGGLFEGSYRWKVSPTFTAGAGALLFITGDTWNNTVSSPISIPGCASLRGALGATAVSAYGVGSARWQLVPRFGAGALVGLGAAGYIVDDVGGDLFVPSCTPSPGLQPSVLLGAELDYAITSTVRIAAWPFTLQAQPSFDGTRRSPVDATGAWIRFMLGIGLGFDL